MFPARLQTLRRIIAEAGLDAIALMPGCNMVYLTGQHFHLMERPTLAIYPREGDPVVILPSLEILKFAQPPYPLQIFTYTDEDGPETRSRPGCKPLDWRASAWAWKGWSCAFWNWGCYSVTRRGSPWWTPPSRWPRCA